MFVHNPDTMRALRDAADPLPAGPAKEEVLAGDDFPEIVGGLQGGPHSVMLRSPRPEGDGKRTIARIFEMLDELGRKQAELAAKVEAAAKGRGLLPAFRRPPRAGVNATPLGDDARRENRR
jgi:hypothetical protein